jgi:hypothetical protein
VPDGEQEGSDEGLPGDTVVLRGGSNMTTMHLSDRFVAYATLCKSEKRSPEYRLSVNAIPGLKADELAQRAALVHPKVRTSTVGAIVDAGFTVEPTPGRRDTDGHCSLYLTRGLDHQPNGIEIAKLIQAFSKPIPNAGQKQRREGRRR